MKEALFVSFSEHSRYAIAKLVPAHGSRINGLLFINHDMSPGDPKGEVVISGWVNNVPKGVHGFHVHENGATGNDCKLAGGHFNPTNVIQSKLMCIDVKKLNHLQVFT